MGAVGSEEGEGSYVNIRLGNAKELGLRGNQDNRWVAKHGDKKWKSDVKHGHGFFSGLDKSSMEKDLAKLGAAQGKIGQASAKKMKETLSSFPEYSNIEVYTPQEIKKREAQAQVQPQVQPQPPSLLQPQTKPKDTTQDFYSLLYGDRTKKAGGNKT